MSKTIPFARLLARRWFRALRPPHAFVAGARRLVYVARPAAPGGPLRRLERPLPPEALAPGRGGIPLAAAPFSAAVASLVREAGGKVPAASLIVPDTWVKVVTVDVEKPEENPKEVDEILLWKLGKLFGEPVPPLRVAWQTAGPSAEGTRVVSLGTPEEAVSSWEAAFQAHGVRIGAVETASIALSLMYRRLVAEDGFLVWAQEDAASTVFIRRGQLRFLRTKATSDPEEALQEIRLAASFFDADTAGAPPAAEGRPSIAVDGYCAAGPAGSPVVERLRTFRAENGGRDIVPISGQALAIEGRPQDPAILLGLGALTGESW